MRTKHEDLMVLDGVAVNSSLASTKNYKAIWLQNIAYYSVQLVFTGTPAGNFKLQASNDLGNPQAATEAQREAGITNWTDIADTATTISAAGDLMYNVQNAGYLWVRVVWTATGAGSTPVLTSAKAFVKGV